MQPYVVCAVTLHRYQIDYKTYWMADRMADRMAKNDKFNTQYIGYTELTFLRDT